MNDRMRGFLMGCTAKVSKERNEAQAHITQLKAQLQSVEEAHAASIGEVGRLETLAGPEHRCFATIAGERMADAITREVTAGRIDSRCEMADAALDFSDPDFERVEAVDELRAKAAALAAQLQSTEEAHALETRELGKQLASTSIDALGLERALEKAKAAHAASISEVGRLRHCIDRAISHFTGPIGDERALLQRLRRARSELVEALQLGKGKECD